MELSREKIIGKLEAMKQSMAEVEHNAMVLARQSTHVDWRRRMQAVLDKHTQQLEELAFALKLLPPVAEGALDQTPAEPIDHKQEGNDHPPQPTTTQQGVANEQSKTEEKTAGTEGTAPASDAPTNTNSTGSAAGASAGATRLGNNRLGRG